MAKKSARTIVGSPLDPAMLRDLGVQWPRAPRLGDFNPESRWVHTYQIWTSHGYRQTGNETMGYLRIGREAGGSQGLFTLNVAQTVVQNEGVEHVTEATIRCTNDPIASPRQWQLTSRIITAKGVERKELAVEEQVHVGERLCEIRTGNHSVKRQWPKPMTGDWCLFDAVQRLAFHKESELDFHLLEGMSLFKKDQHLSYNGVHKNPDLSDEPLYLFRQLGRGVLPYEYWLDGDHRLLMVITGSRAYILDERAEEAAKEYQRSQKSRYESLKTQSGGGQ